MALRQRGLSHCTQGTETRRRVLRTPQPGRCDAAFEPFLLVQVAIGFQGYLGPLRPLQRSIKPRAPRGDTPPRTRCRSHPPFCRVRHFPASLHPKGPPQSDNRSFRKKGYGETLAGRTDVRLHLAPRFLGGTLRAHGRQNLLFLVQERSDSLRHRGRPPRTWRGHGYLPEIFRSEPRPRTDGRRRYPFRLFRASVDLGNSTARISATTLSRAILETTSSPLRQRARNCRSPCSKAVPARSSRSSMNIPNPTPAGLPGHDFQKDNYRLLLEKILSEPWLGVIFKPKRPKNLRQRLGLEVANLLSSAGHGPLPHTRAKRLPQRADARRSGDGCRYHPRPHLSRDGRDGSGTGRCPDASDRSRRLSRQSVLSPR